MSKLIKVVKYDDCVESVVLEKSWKVPEIIC